MPHLPIDELKPGMALACDLKASDGRLLLPSGVELAESHLEMLRRVGVVEVEVNTPCTEEDMARGARYVRRFFEYVDHDDPVMNALFEIAARRTAAAMASGWEPSELDPRMAADNEHLEDLYQRGEGTAKDLVDHEEEIASFPDVYFRLKEVLGQDNVSARDVARVVNSDAGLSSRLLKLVNSPFYGFSASIDSVERAVALVGERELSTLAIGISAISYFKDIPPELISMKIFWKHSLACAVLSAIIAGKCGDLATEQLFTAGLLHDVGRLIMFKKQPYGSVEALIFARANDFPLVEAERQTFGFDHTDIAAHLLEAWQFPKTLREMVIHHHSPEDSKAHPKASAVIQLADSMTNALEISEGGAFVVPPIANGTFGRLGLYPKDLQTIAMEFDKQFSDMAGAFL